MRKRPRGPALSYHAHGNDNGDRLCLGIGVGRCGVELGIAYDLPFKLHGLLCRSQPHAGRLYPRGQPLFAAGTLSNGPFCPDAYCLSL